jgi:N-acetylglucosaminyldiphosphoundecaprenol N-acetyl-beta-D-mannosaminyltransferase
MKRVDFYNIPLDLGSEDEVISLVDKSLANNQQLSISFINAHCYNVLSKDDEYKNHISNSFDLVLNDGIGVKIGAKLKKINVEHNLNGTDFIPAVLKKTNKASKAFFLGAGEGVAKKAASLMNESLGFEKVCASHSGYFDKDQTIVDIINESGAEILIVGMGVPYQEKWISENKHKMTLVKVLIAGGAVIDFMSGRVKRAPRLFRSLGLEWLFRLLNEPRRLFKRYVWGNFLFFINIARSK